jgi:hypothetical protein
VKRFRATIVLLSVASIAALMSHVVIDVLGDFMLAHDTYDDVEHSSRTVVGLVVLGFALSGIAFGFRAALREARGSENAFCQALRSALPRRTLLFVTAALIVASVLLCLMEGCDAWLAGQAVDDLGDLFGGSILLGGTVVGLTTTVMSLCALALLRRLARSRAFALAIAIFLQREPVDSCRGRSSRRHRADLLVFHPRLLCRAIAGRAPPQLLRVKLK